MSFFENTRKPAGFGGKIMVAAMNLGHRALARWGLQFANAPKDARVLDCGCGGGANVKKLLKKFPDGIVKGIDYSPVSVEKSRRLNSSAIADGRCVIMRGDITERIFAAGWFDLVTAFETVYFWQDMPAAFNEIFRMLKPGGEFLICNECGGENPKDDRWTEKIPGMVIPTAEALEKALAQAGFSAVEIHRSEKGWLCVVAKK